MAQLTSAPGWYPDPIHHHEHRYYDGVEWTSHVADRGETSEEPLPTALSTEATRNHPGGRALAWGAVGVAVGVVLTIVGNAMGGDDATKQEALRGGLMVGVGGLLLIVAVVTLVVGLVAMFRHRDRPGT